MFSKLFSRKTKAQLRELDSTETRCVAGGFGSQYNQMSYRLYKTGSSSNTSLYINVHSDIITSGEIR